MTWFIYLSDLGEVPLGFGNLVNLKLLELDSNNLSGEIPPPIFNLVELSLFGNRFSGGLPENIDVLLPDFEGLYLAQNSFVGPIPASITNISKLLVVSFSENSISGFIPAELGNLRNLKWLNLFGNNLTATSDMSFLKSFESYKNLPELQLGGNPINGIFPQSIGDLSISLETFTMGMCNIVGRIPEDIGNLSRLITFSLRNNQLTGNVPATIKRLKNLQGLYLENNRLEGHIPHKLCCMNKLSELFSNNNNLSGSIPSCIGNVTTLKRS